MVRKNAGPIQDALVEFLAPPSAMAERVRIIAVRAAVCEVSEVRSSCGNGLAG